MTSAARKETTLTFRATVNQRELLELAAEATGKTLTAFVLDAASVEAQRALIDRRIFRLDDAHWALFTEALDRPTVEKPRLRDLLHTPGALG